MIIGTMSERQGVGTTTDKQPGTGVYARLQEFLNIIRCEWYWESTWNPCEWHEREAQDRKRISLVNYDVSFFLFWFFLHHLFSFFLPPVISNIPRAGMPSWRREEGRMTLALSREPPKACGQL